MKKRTKYNFSAALVTTILVEFLFFILVLFWFFGLGEFIPNMQYENPILVWLFLILPTLSIVYLLSLRSKNKRLQKFADASLISFLIPDLSSTRSIFKYFLFRIGVGLLIVGMIDPKIGTKLQEVKTSGQDIYIALDISNSMLAEDIQPNRLERAKMAMFQFIKKLDGDRIGVIIFAGSAYVQLPLTTDYQAANLFVDQVSTDMLSAQGTAIGDAISLALESFDPESEAHKSVILITDGENHEGEAVKAVKQAEEIGVVVHAIGMGTLEGGPIPNKDRYGNILGYKKDFQGTTIITALNETMLHQIVDIGNGVFIRANTTNVGLQELMNEIEAVDETELETITYSEYEHRFQWFFGLGLLFLIFNYLISASRKKWSEALGIMD